MSMKTVCNLCLLAAVAFLFTACATVRETTRTAPAQAGQEMPKRAGGTLLHAFLNNDSSTFLSLLPAAIAEDFGKKGFKETRDTMLKDLGTPISYSYVCNLEHPTFTVSIWKILLERKSADGTKTIRQEAMFRAVSGKVDNEERILGFNFF